MNLHDYAVEELSRAGLFSKDSDYEGMIGEAVLELIDVFRSQGHSGLSAMMVLDAFYKLAAYEPLTPLTYEPTEWNYVGENMWQNRRKSTTFSTDGGKTHYDLEDR